MAELEKLAAKSPVAMFAVWRASTMRRSFPNRLKDFTDKIRRS